MTSVGEEFIAFSVAADENESSESVQPIALLTENAAPWLLYCKNPPLRLHKNDKSYNSASSRPKASKFLNLHNEILSFCEFIAPSREETASRRTLLEEFTVIISKLFPSATVHIFGSQYTAILTPTSDMDVAVLGVPGDDVG